ncbi:uncharacterized protein LOC141713569 isoform X2 [Apium graveolens]|uniref:uncharacterized protein LOC141713569 isoform X2 n=1 Tax=Apium graveolens TaxID=4045 RepID=UPI003D7A0C13
MDVNVSNACSHRSQPSKCFEKFLENANVDCMISEKNALDFLYVNHAEVAWHERRRAWVGDTPQRSPRLQSRSIREKILSGSTTYKELLSTTEPFKGAIPLAFLPYFRTYGF